MIDARITPWVQRLIQPLVSYLSSKNVTANQVTVVGFLLGLFAVPMILLSCWQAALFFIALNRIFDGIDGQLARQQQNSSSAGGYLDICLDFLFYASIPLAFGLAEPQLWGPAALVLMLAFIGTGSSFLAFAAAAETYQLQRPQFSNKSFYYMQGLTEGTETIAVFVAFCLWPEYFPWLAYGFALACFITIITRIAGGFRTLQQAEASIERNPET